MIDRRRALPWLALSAVGCQQAAEESPANARLSVEQLKDPETCRPCHERHYREWRSSMHAYATDDPIFLAMNQRGQAEAAIGDFCVRCHAPMAVLEGWTDYANPERLPPAEKGVTCYFCHSVEGVGEPHNNSLLVSTANDTLFGPYADPDSAAPHRAAHSPYLDGRTRESSEMCGACHDIRLPSGVHLERTFAEWEDSLLNGQGCARGCHMQGRSGSAVEGVAAPAGVRPRSVLDGEGVHEHLFAAVDTVLTPWAEDDPISNDVQRAAVECELAEAVQVTEICLSPAAGGYEIQLSLEAVGVGHAWPSGAAQDRRAWVEVRAYSGGQMLFESAPRDGERLLDAAGDPSRQLAVLRDHVTGADGQDVHMFWQVAPSAQNPAGYRAHTIPSGVDHTLRLRYNVFGARPDRIETVVKLRAVGEDVLEDLYQSGYLQPTDHDEVPTLTLERTRVTWQPRAASDCQRNPEVSVPAFDCRSAYRELLQHEGTRNTAVMSVAGAKK